MKRRFEFLFEPLSVVILIAFAIITNLFYTTDFRVSLENFFYDVRTRWKPTGAIPQNVVIISIEDKSISELEKDSFRLRTDGQKRPYLSLKFLTQASSILANSNASAIAFLMPEYAFPATDIDMLEFVDIVRFDSRMFIGTTGYNQPIPNLSKLPSVFEKISAQVAGYETFRSRSNAIIRYLPSTSYRGLTEVESLPVKIASKFNPKIDSQNGSYLLKYHEPRLFKQIPLSDFLRSPSQWLPDLDNKIVVLGYTANRDAGFQTTEMMFANTPYTGFHANTANGVSTTWLLANALENLSTDETLTNASGFSVILQTMAVAGICFWSWQLGSMAASIITLSLWGLLIVAHGFLYTYASLHVPLADTFLATVFVSIFAATNRMRAEIRQMATNQVKFQAQSEITAIQSVFLTGFAEWLKSMTSDVVNLVKKSPLAQSTDPKILDLYARAYASGEDFSEYLETIRQIPKMESLSKGKLRREIFDVVELVKVILRRFDSKAKARNVNFRLEVRTEKVMVRSTAQLVDAIIFNFISNAVKYGPEHDDIIITIERDPKSRLVVSVKDHGPGIPDEFKERIFERFYRIRDERIYTTKGSGLGLYLCRYFSDALGGTIHTVSSGNSGSEFKLVLP